VDDSKYKEILSVTMVDGSRVQLFSIDRDYKLWTMFMTDDIPIASWNDWAAFPLPGDSGGVMKITASPGQTINQSPIGNIYYYPRLWAIDLKNDLWSCEGVFNPGGFPWTKWAPWVAPYPNS
jgi:hypothetical protein